MRYIRAAGYSATENHSCNMALKHYSEQFQRNIAKLLIVAKRFRTNAH